MLDNHIVAGGTWSTLVAVTVVVVLLGLVLFAGGKPSDVTKGRWQVWLISGLVMVALIFFLSRGVAGLTYKSCSATSYVAC